MVSSISHYTASEDEDHAPERLQSRYTAHVPEEQWPTFKARLEPELRQAEEQCPEDAARSLLLMARVRCGITSSNRRFCEYHKPIDFWHTAEHLSLAAEVLFGKGSDAAKEWHAKYRAQLLESGYGGHKIRRSID